MSDVEKNVAEQLKEMLDATVAEKADKADLEGVVKSEDLEAAKAATAEEIAASKAAHDAELEAVKSAAAEAVEAAKTEIREEMEAKFAEAPALTVKKDTNVLEFVEKTLQSGEVVKQAEVDLFRKASPAGSISGSNDVTGSLEDGMSTWHTLTQFNPFRGDITVMQANNAAIVIPQLSGITFAEETPVDSGRANSGAMSERRVVITNWASQSQFSKPALEDVQGVREAISSMILQQYSVAQATDIAKVLKAGVSGDNTPVNTGDSEIRRVEYDISASTNDIEDATAIIGAMTNLVAGVGVAYRTNGKFHVSPAVYATLTQSNNTTLNFDPTTGLFRLFGYPVVINSYLDDGGTAADVSCYFGDFRRGAILAERRALEVNEYPQTAPGLMTYYSNGRFKPSVWDGSALVAMVTIA